MRDGEVALSLGNGWVEVDDLSALRRSAGNVLWSHVSVFVSGETSAATVAAEYRAPFGANGHRL
jgi:hypothetical protein